MKKHFNTLVIFCLLSVFITGCGNKADTTDNPDDKNTGLQSEASISDATTSDATYDMVANSDEMATPTDLTDENLEPVYADELYDGVYPIEVLSSSSMFNIVSCYLTVADGDMTAVMTMSGKGYLYVYMGTGEAAARADEGAYIGYEENETGEHTFTVPVEALDKAVDCAAFSKNKEKWYDRQLVFSAASLPDEAYAVARYNTVGDLTLMDGEYTIEVTLTGGSGKASVTSPAALKVEDGIAYATIEWSSNNYDYMTVGDSVYFPVSVSEYSVFEIPVTGFDYEMPVTADTTAMSTPHEIEYTLYFDSETIK